MGGGSPSPEGWPAPAPRDSDSACTYLLGWITCLTLCVKTPPPCHVVFRHGGMILRTGRELDESLCLCLSLALALPLPFPLSLSLSLSRSLSLRPFSRPFSSSPLSVPEQACCGTAWSADGSGAQARFHNFCGIAADGDDKIILVNTTSCQIRKTGPDASVSTVSGQQPRRPGGRPCRAGPIPRSLRWIGNGNIIVADRGTTGSARFVRSPV